MFTVVAEVVVAFRSMTDGNAGRVSTRVSIAYYLLGTKRKLISRRGRRDEDGDEEQEQEQERERERKQEQDQEQHQQPRKHKDTDKDQNKNTNKNQKRL